MTKLNLGCGGRKLDGYINIDAAAECEPDMVLSLGTMVLPFPEGSVTEVQAHHVLEHLNHTELCALMQDLYAVMQPGALMKITVPHPAGDSFWGDPTHVTPITLNTLNLFSRKFCENAQTKRWSNTPLALYLKVDFEVTERGYDLTAPYKSRRVPADELNHAIAHNVNVVNEMYFTLRRV